MINCLIIVALLMMVSLAFRYKTGDKNVSTGMMDMPYTTVAKGIAILLVLICHTSGTMGTVVFTPCGGIGVAMFLICSGYGLSESWKKYGRRFYWRKKLTRVYIPYAIVVLCLSIYKGDDIAQMCTKLLTGGGILVHLLSDEMVCGILDSNAGSSSLSYKHNVGSGCGVLLLPVEHRVGTIAVVPDRSIAF